MTNTLPTEGSSVSNRQIFLKYKKLVKDKFTIVTKSNKGISAQIFYDLVQLSGVEKKLFAEEVFDLSFKTIQRYSKEKKDFGARHTELALKLVFLYMKGKEVFGNIESFNRWLRKPAYGLNKKIPYNLINTVTGIDLINDELLRIEFGDLA